jgi:large subunit ribosomal protein L23
MNEYDIVIRPLITEKSSLLRDNGNQYIFEVRRDANKIEIKKAIEKLFKVNSGGFQASGLIGKRQL